MTKFLDDKDIDEFFSDDNAGRNETLLKCVNCGKDFSMIAPGTKNRNHCPYCLYSLHVDKNVGDRKSTCFGPMTAVGKFTRPNGEEVIIHRCTVCGNTSNNRVAGDDNEELVQKLPVLNKQ